MKRETLYLICFEKAGEISTRYFKRKQKVFNFALGCGDTDWVIHRLSMIGIGMRKSLSKRAWKKSRLIYYYGDRKIDAGNCSGGSLNELSEFEQSVFASFERVTG